ncbi:hypothetical protein M5K25_014571 [Dendrobium thyrsiflorum]|uniref:Uncharacterized protein n=1 Tax=Dendrobium thyrsiflorum TaxID=117978 RepID=A0ABD0UND2_DENTH
MSYPTDDNLEQKETYDEVLKCRYLMYMDGKGLSEVGWSWTFLQQRFRDHDGHFALMSILKIRIGEIGRKEDGSVEVNAEKLITDVDHYVFYTRWHNLSDAFLSESYRKLNIVADWQYIQKEFSEKFICCPTLSQLQARMRIIMANM